MNNRVYYRTDLDEDIYLYNQGKNYKSYLFLGAHKYKQEKRDMVSFCLWAPNAKEIYLVGDFNCWDQVNLPMKNINNSGIWNICLEGVEDFANYKYRIISRDNRVIYKADPYAFHAETRPNTASKYYQIDNYKWKDGKYQKNKPLSNKDKPMSIYEMHMGSWMRHEDGTYFSYNELEKILPAYLKKMNFTHVEFLPLTEYPYDGSWGYQVTGYYAATSRFGKPEDLMSLIDRLHENGIGVILDWVPVHFTKDDHGLREFDGSSLYEKSDPYRASADGWGTLYFDLYKAQVKNFLISSALFWLEYYHIDGIRVDAVAAMLYINYGGKNLTNMYGGQENLEAIDFLKEFNYAVHEYFPNAMTIAEESTAWPKITARLEDGGLGFDYKWNMGWMNDTLSYFESDPIHRKYKQDKLTFSITYCFSENFILPFSHDEVVHLKKSMLSKMPGFYEDKFKGLMSLYAYMYGHPGKKLLFMGNEIGTFDEWNEDIGLAWSVLDYEKHTYLQAFVRDLNLLYKNESALYEVDDSYAGYEWIEHENHDESIIAFERINRQGDKIICLYNFTPVFRKSYRIGVDHKGIYRVLLNSASKRYGGPVQRYSPLYSENEGRHGKMHSICVDLHPYQAIFIKLSHRF